MPLINNPLSRILESYFFTRDALTVTDLLIDLRSFDTNAGFPLGGTRYEHVSRDNATEELLLCYDLLDDYFVLALWAAFEHELIDFISRRFPYVAQANDTPEVEKALTRIHNKFVERGSTDDRISLFKNVVPADLLKTTRDIKDYRDWVAHQNPSRTRPKKVDAETAYLYLTSFLEEIDHFS